MKKILLSALLLSSSLFAGASPTAQVDLNKTNNKKITNNVINKKINMNKLAIQHQNYVIDYQTFLQRLKNHKLDYNKPVILLVGTPDCKWTVQEMKEILGYPPLWNEVRNNFTLVFVNLLKDKLPEAFLISITPTMYFVSPINGNILTDKPVAGYVDKNELVEYLKGLKKAWDIYLKKQKLNKNKKGGN